ncbi:MAG: 50S ribosomal protein L1 [Treponema bryantii]|nr:50S ribosomal protein L1 [Treponema bryantii]MBQ7970106.1 50S ribosomal protein L1 [Treponema sp.]
MKHGKNYKNAAAKYDLTKKYDVASACKMVQDMKFAKFDETVEAHVSLRLEKNQTVRDTLVFPNQFRGEKKVLVFCKEDKVQEALDAGAAYAGSDEYIEKVKGGWLDFDVCVATPDMMKDVGRLGMVLGRKGLMPNPKTGTVTPDVGKAVAELKKGRTEFRADKGGVVHIAVGKCSMDTEKVVENISTLISEVGRKKPAGSSAGFVQSVSISSSMGPGVWVDIKEGE